MILGKNELLGEAYKGQKIHVRVLMEGFLEGNDILRGALVDMYVYEMWHAL